MSKYDRAYIEVIILYIAFIAFFLLAVTEIKNFTSTSTVSKGWECIETETEDGITYCTDIKRITYED